MKIETFYFDGKNGWSVEKFPEMDSKNTLILVFASPAFKQSPEPIYEIANHYPHSQMIGCSTAGEISNTNIMDETITFTIIQFHKTQIRTTLALLEDKQNSFDAGKKIGLSLFQEDLEGIFILSEGLNVNGSELARGLNSIPKNIVITGGLAGDKASFKQTWLIYEGKIVENAIAAVGFYGKSIKIGFSHCGGWDAFGPERQITHAKENVLYELDNKPALDLYKEYLGEKASGLPAAGLFFPLGIRKNKNEDAWLVRTILGINEEEKSLIFAGDIPTGYWAKLMRTNAENLINGAQVAAESAKQYVQLNSQDNQTLAIAISCVGRRLVLGERSDEEVESTFFTFPEGIKQVGFYSYGELSPHQGLACELHNQTMTLTTLCEMD